MLRDISRESIGTRAEPARARALPGSIQNILDIVRRQLWIILIGLLVVSGSGVAYLFILRPTYTATATMLIESRQGGIQQKSVLGDTSPSDNSWMDSQIGILNLQKFVVAQSVVKQLDLGMHAEVLGAKGALGGDFVAPISGLFRSQGARDQFAQSEDQIAQEIAGAVAGGLEVRRVGLSYLVNVNFSSHDHGEAVSIANAAADAYVAAEMTAKSQGLRQASNWLQERYQTLRDQASAAERAVAEFKAKNNIVTAEGKPIADREVEGISERLAAARAKTADEQSRLNQIESMIRNQEATGTFDSTVSDALLNPIVTKLRSDYLDLLNKEADWSKRFGPNHQAVVNLRNQERDIRVSTHEELKRIAESYRSELEISKQNEIELQKQLSVVVHQVSSDAQIVLQSLESTAQSYHTFYDNFFLNYTESIQQQSSPIPDTRVVSYATWAAKTNPSPPRTIFLSILGGLALGFGVAMLRESLDRALRSSAEVHSQFQLDCLGLVPDLAALRGKRRARFGPLVTIEKDVVGEVAENIDRFQIVDSSCDALRAMIDTPFSQFAEVIRGLKMAADLRGGGAAKVIGLTSSLAGEGKSTVATALATLSGQTGARVILLDCDLRNSALSRTLAPSADRGLLEVLAGNCPLENAVWVELESGFEFLPAVNFARFANTDQILGCRSMHELFGVLRRSYDYIIVDLSPLLPVVDVCATNGLIDSYIFLIEWGRTTSDAVRQALYRSQTLHNSFLGFALNKVNMNVIGRYEGDYINHYGQ